MKKETIFVFIFFMFIFFIGLANAGECIGSNYVDCRKTEPECNSNVCEWNGLECKPKDYMSSLNCELKPDRTGCKHDWVCANYREGPGGQFLTNLCFQCTYYPEEVVGNMVFPAMCSGVGSTMGGGGTNCCNPYDPDFCPNCASKITWYGDADLDGHGDINKPRMFCPNISPGIGFSSTSDDCDDGDNSVYMVEQWYQDQDGDGWDGARQFSCGAPVGSMWSRIAGKGMDCLDINPAINPDANEDCMDSSPDENCNGLENCEDPACSVGVACGIVTPKICCPDQTCMPKIDVYGDSDADGFGNLNDKRTICNALEFWPAGYVESPGDCNDANKDVYPGKCGTGENICKRCYGTTNNGGVFLIDDRCNHGSASSNLLFGQGDCQSCYNGVMFFDSLDLPRNDPNYACKKCVSPNVIEPKADNIPCGTNNMCCGGNCISEFSDDNCGRCGNKCECGRCIRISTEFECSTDPRNILLFGLDNAEKERLRNEISNMLFSTGNSVDDSGLGGWLRNNAWNLALNALANLAQINSETGQYGIFLWSFTIPGFGPASFSLVYTQVCDRSGSGQRFNVGQVHIPGVTCRVGQITNPAQAGLPPCPATN